MHDSTRRARGLLGKTHVRVNIPLTIVQAIGLPDHYVQPPTIVHLDPPRPHAPAPGIHMHEQSPERPALTDMQRARLDYARRDLENFRATDLTQLDAAGLALIIQRLLTRVDDLLQVTDEVIAS